MHSMTVRCVYQRIFGSQISEFNLSRSPSFVFIAIHPNTAILLQNSHQNTYELENNYRVSLSIDLLAFYRDCRSLLGYATHYI